MPAKRVRERDLVKPVLKLIYEYGDDTGGLDVTKLDELLRIQFDLSVEDRAILKGRKDDRFSQVVRNLVSHRTLERQGLAEYRTAGPYKRGAYYLTPKGVATIEDIPQAPKQPDLFDERKTL